jgi:ComF family protein
MTETRWMRVFAHKQATCRWIGKLLDALLPRHCAVCGLYCGNGNLCLPCASGLPRIDHSCARCGIPVAAQCDRLCGACLTKPPPWKRAVAGLVYRFPVDQLVCQFKFNRNFACGEVLGSELLRAVREKQADLPDLITPVPLHRTRHFSRSFNQAEILARRLGRNLGIPVSTTLLRRTRRTRAQSGLDRKTRRRNISGAFIVKPRGRALANVNHVALVDDVMTTGETLADCCRAWKRAGVGNISAWVAARAAYW